MRFALIVIPTTTMGACSVVTVPVKVAVKTVSTTVETTKTTVDVAAKVVDVLAPNSENTESTR